MVRIRPPMTLEILERVIPSCSDEMREKRQQKWRGNEGLPSWAHCSLTRLVSSKIHSDEIANYPVAVSTRLASASCLAVVLSVNCPA